MLCGAGSIKMTQVTQGKINSGSHVPGEAGTGFSGAQSSPSTTGGAAWRGLEQQRHGAAPHGRAGSGTPGWTSALSSPQMRWVRGMKMTQNWVQWVVCQMLVAPKFTFGRTWTGCRNGRTGTS